MIELENLRHDDLEAAAAAAQHDAGARITYRKGNQEGRNERQQYVPGRFWRDTLFPIYSPLPASVKRSIRAMTDLCVEQRELELANKIRASLVQGLLMKLHEPLKLPYLKFDYHVEEQKSCVRVQFLRNADKFVSSVSNDTTPKLHHETFILSSAPLDISILSLSYAFLSTFIRSTREPRENIHFAFVTALLHTCGASPQALHAFSSWEPPFSSRVRKTVGVKSLRDSRFDKNTRSNTQHLHATSRVLNTQSSIFSPQIYDALARVRAADKRPDISNAACFFVPESPLELTSDLMYYKDRPHLRKVKFHTVCVFKAPIGNAASKQQRWIVDVKEKELLIILYEELGLTPSCAGAFSNIQFWRNTLSALPTMRKLDSIDLEIPRSIDAFADEQSPLKIVLSTLLRKTGKDCDRVQELLASLRWRVRESSSNMKSYYLLHLKDILDAQVANFKDMKSRVENTPICQDLDKNWKQMLIKDLDHLEKESLKMLQEAEDVEQFLFIQLENSNRYWTTMLAVIAAIYLPLSLATGIYGMNIREINNGTPYWWAVVATGLTLVATTIITPLLFDRVFRTVLKTLQNPVFYYTVVAPLKIAYVDTPGYVFREVKRMWTSLGEILVKKDEAND